MTTATMIRPEIRVFRATEGDVASTWGRAVAELGQSRLAHAPEWFAVIRNAYGHEPLYLSAEDGSGRRGILPAFIVRRPMVGAVVSSMPFLDGGGPCSPSAALADALVEGLIAEARGVGAQTVELRCPQKLGIGGKPMEHKVNLTLVLPADPARLWQELDGRVRNQIRKAERSGLSVEFGGTERLGDFYAIFAARMRELGSPVHGQGFFRAMFQAFGGRARVAVVRQGTTPVGSLIALGFKDTLVVPWASCLRTYAALCPNMLLYWETMRVGCREGFRQFDFGRSTRGSGTYRFKRQWGAEEEPLLWHTIRLNGRRPPVREGTGRGAALLTGSWRRLPLALTRSLGPRLRRYLTQ